MKRREKLCENNEQKQKKGEKSKERMNEWKYEEGRKKEQTQKRIKEILE